MAPPDTLQVVVVGGGIGGLVTAACLSRFGLRVRVLERREASAAETGADLALWPAAVRVLRDVVGVEDAFFETCCYNVRTVLMRTMDFTEGGAATVLQELDMARVCEGRGGDFCLVRRSVLMEAVAACVPEGVVEFGARVVEVRDGVVVLADGEVVQADVIIGADGARSVVRDFVAPEAGEPVYCGEVAHRGVLELSKHDTALAGLFQGGGANGDHAMSINYGAGLRSSWGVMSNANDVGYWWVKEVTPDAGVHAGTAAECPWPEPLKTLHDSTPPSSKYVHAVYDMRELPRWHKGSAVVIGDAAHLCSPNQGQGACMAVEDGFALGVALASLAAGQAVQDAFEEYAAMRKAFCTQIQAESRTQLTVGQLTHPWLVAGRNWLLGLVPTSVLEGKLLANHWAEIDECISRAGGLGKA